MNIAVVEGDSIKLPAGIEKGPSYSSINTLKHVTLINFDKDTLLDDYSFLSCIPTAVFSYGEQLLSHPLLFYDDPYQVNYDYEKTLNANQGLNYFMEDWMSYCNQNLEQMTLINIDKEKVTQWDADTYQIINGDNPYDLSSLIALNEWSYANTAVLAIIKPTYEKNVNHSDYTISGTLKACNIKKIQLNMQKPVIGTGATYNTFQINNPDYKYLITKISWKGKEDYDLQIYDPLLGMVQSGFSTYDSDYPFYELLGSYIFNLGTWEISVSAQAKKIINEKGKMEEMCFYPTPQPTGFQRLFQTNTVDVDISLVPGITIPMEPIPYGCRNINMTLTSDSSIPLGFTIIDPIGTEIASSFSLEDIHVSNQDLTGTNSKIHEVNLQLKTLGVTESIENFFICVFGLENISHPVDFSIEYNWNQEIQKEKGESIDSACNAAILSSTINCPLLYINPEKLAENTKNVLYKLGVKNCYIVDIGKHLSKQTLRDIKDIIKVKNHFKDHIAIYDEIRSRTKANDIIFTTIEPYNYWYIADETKGSGRKSEGQWNEAYHFAQAAYVAAHHGSPVIIVDNHPILSQARTWATNWWHENAYYRMNRLPSAGAMTLTAQRAYEFLEDFGFGSIEIGGPEKQIQETIITVAGQFDIGIPWDRAFTGAGLNGRFWGHPVDSAYAINRNIFYPALIFENPGMKQTNLINGSESSSKSVVGRIKKPLGSTLVITKQMQEESFQYPILQTFCTYGYRYNEQGWKHFNCKYVRADGIIPWETASPNPIDDGVAHGKTGAYYPDMSESEVIPFYCKKAGYDNVFSTNVEYVAENLNRGVIVWASQIHGNQFNGGGLEFWAEDNPYTDEDNPWRAYEPIALKPGNLDEFIRWFFYNTYHRSIEFTGEEHPWMEKISQIPKRLIEVFPEYGSTENPDTAFLNQQLQKIAQLAQPITSSNLIDIWGPWPFMIYRDRIIRPFQSLKQGLPLFNFHNGDGKVCHSPPTGGKLVGKVVNGPEFDNILDNIHSVGINSISCLPAFTYIHLTWMRHGSVYQIIDPWTTTDWAGLWNQMLIKLFAMGYTVGQAYERGLRAVGPEYSCGQSWWDNWENVCYTGDPNLRVFVPNTGYVDKQRGYEENYWTEFETRPLSDTSNYCLDGHIPYIVSSYPNAYEPNSFIEKLLPFIMLIVIAFIGIVFIYIRKINK